jgi:hypothetical protein
MWESKYKQQVNTLTLSKANILYNRLDFFQNKNHLTKTPRYFYQKYSHIFQKTEMIKPKTLPFHITKQCQLFLFFWFKGY